MLVMNNLKMKLENNSISKGNKMEKLSRNIINTGV